MFRLHASGTIVRSVSLLMGSMVLFNLGFMVSPQVLAQMGGDSCTLQNQAGNVINLPGVCRTTTAPTTTRAVSGSRAAQCKALMDIKDPETDPSLGINIDIKTEVSSVGSDPSQTVTSTKMSITGPDGVTPATRADVVRNILAATAWIDHEVNRLKGLSFQDTQLQQYRGLLIQFGTQQSQAIRQITTQPKLSKEQMIEQTGNLLFGLMLNPPSWLIALDQYCESSKPSKKRN